MAARRSQGRRERFSRTMLSSTSAPSARLAGAPKSVAPAPPPRSVMPTLIRLTPIRVMTMPVTSGVITRRRWPRKRLRTICTKAPKKHTPKIIARISSGPPPRCFTSIPAASTAPRKAKLVPCRQIIPAPMPNGRRAWIRVPAPETISAMLIKYGRCSPRPSREPITSGGVTMPTKLASTCCSAARKAGSGRGRSSRP